ncbi:cytochrome P450 like protein [Artemisia annua]|uniref:Cytochrome P450 like protein n=1 Tax=Artemisia annua TaxID=35608 RepID=A0A2U1MRP6_ARTAN|nr:cytochrome P450 like protein [Artemisia annua]
MVPRLTLNDKAYYEATKVSRCLVEFLHFDIQGTGQKSHCVSIRRDHRNALFQLNSRIPLVRTNSEFAVRRPGKATNTNNSVRKNNG